MPPQNEQHHHTKQGEYNQMFFLVVGLILYVIGAINILIAEFSESILWGLFGFFTQIGNILFAILHFDKCKKGLSYILLGILFIILAIVFA